MVAGGGASVIYADTVGDLGYAHELGNYAEYRCITKRQALQHLPGQQLSVIYAYIEGDLGYAHELSNYAENRC